MCLVPSQGQGDCPICVLQTSAAVELMGRMRQTTAQPTEQTHVGLRFGVLDYRSGRVCGTISECSSQHGTCYTNLSTVLPSVAAEIKITIVAAGLLIFLPVTNGVPAQRTVAEGRHGLVKQKTGDLRLA